MTTDNTEKKMLCRLADWLTGLWIDMHDLRWEQNESLKFVLLSKTKCQYEVSNKEFTITERSNIEMKRENRSEDEAECRL